MDGARTNGLACWTLTIAPMPLEVMRRMAGRALGLTDGPELEGGTSDRASGPGCGWLAATREAGDGGGTSEAKEGMQAARNMTKRGSLLLRGM